MLRKQVQQSLGRVLLCGFVWHHYVESVLPELVCRSVWATVHIPTSKHLDKATDDKQGLA